MEFHSGEMENPLLKTGVPSYVKEIYTDKVLAERRAMCDECDSETCFFNPCGYCLYPLVTGEQPEYNDHDGCLGWVDGDLEAW